MTARAGRVARIWRYAVKSMAGEELPGCELAAQGIPGDRGWALREKGGAAMSAKRWPKLLLCAARYLEPPSPESFPPARIELPGEAGFLSDDPQAARRLSGYMGLPVELARGPHFDAHPVHLVTTASLAELRRRAPGLDFDVRRFRPNFLIETPEKDGFPELAWIGRRLRLGTAILEARKPTKRCVMTTLPQGALPKEPGILRALAREAGNDLGLYCRVLQPGRVAKSDILEWQT